ncbi:MAG: pyruvate dehydrogenase, partial [Planctomycetes bacterium]|nr:pyruvate dehydrogenase [Planctomycetota bacterium]
MKALTIRRTEERFLALFAEGRISGTVHTCVGQEWVGIAVAEALEPQDYVFGNHRSHGHYLARTDDVEGLIAEILGRSTGVCGGRGGSQHLCKDRFFTNGVQGGIVPVSAGLALAQEIHQSDGIAVVFIGDGMFGEGVVYETFNMASKWSLPLLIVVEDNGIAQSTSQSETLAGTIGGRARAFGIDVLSANTWSIAELLQRAAEAVRSVRQTRTPVLLHVKTYRLNAHSKGDDDRDPDEVSSYAQRDILNQIISQRSPTVRRWLTDIDRRLDLAVTRAEAAPSTALPTITSTSEPTAEPSLRWRPLTFSRKRIGQAIRDQIADAMARDDRIVVLGE